MSLNLHSSLFLFSLYVRNKYISIQFNSYFFINNCLCLTVVTSGNESAALQSFIVSFSFMTVLVHSICPCSKVFGCIFFSVFSHYQAFPCVRGGQLQFTCMKNTADAVFLFLEKRTLTLHTTCTATNKQVMIAGDKCIALLWKNSDPFSVSMWL